MSESKNADGSFDGAMTGKLNVKIGNVEFSGEGQQAFLDVQLQRVVEALSSSPSLAKSEEPMTPASGVGSSGNSAKFSASLASHIKAMKADGNQVRRFLATADWLRLRGASTVTTAAVSKALIDNQQARLANPALCLNRNVAKGYCEKISGGFYITPEGLKELGYS